MSIEFVAFDVDGVIYSSENFLQESYYQGVIDYLKKNTSKNFIPPKKEDILKNVGKTYREILTSLFPDISEKEMVELRKFILRDLTLKISSKKGVLLNGVFETLSYLKNKNIKIGTASNGSKEYVEAVLRTYNIYEFFNEVKYVGIEEFREKTDILKYYKNKYNLKKNQIIMVGDRITDLIAAREAKTIFVGIKGHGHEKELEGSDFIINNLKQLIKIIESIE